MTQTTDTLADQFLATISPYARLAADAIVEHRIEREYGRDLSVLIAEDTKLAVDAIALDIRDLFNQTNGPGYEHGVRPAAESLLTALVNEGLAARTCQCSKVTTHDHIGQCTAHYELDVPTIEGNLLCGSCHIATYQGRQS